MLNEAVTGSVQPQVMVVDAAGAQQCQNYDNLYSLCKLTGTAPFRAVLSGPSTGSYKVIVQRADATAGCTAWPQSGFGGSWGVQVSTSASKPAVCLTIPANQHSTGEMFDYANTANTYNASVLVNDASGNEICRTVAASTTGCSYSKGAAYTAVLVNGGNNPTDTYRLVRRDVSVSAACSAPASTKVGGASTALTLTSSLDARCLRVTAATADKLWMSVRTAATSGGAVLVVADAAGTLKCWQHGVSCRVGGSTSYQVVVIAENYAGKAIGARVDTWRVGTAAGWAAECTKHVLSADGFGPLHGSFTETSTGYCGVVSAKPHQAFGVYGWSSATSPNVPAVNMFSVDDWVTGNYTFCGGDNYGFFSYSCGFNGATVTGQAVLLITPGSAPTPVRYLTQGVCKQQCTVPPATPTLSSAAPGIGQTGTSTFLTLHGTGLNMGDQVSVTSSGSGNGSWSTPVSVSADGTSLTVEVSLYNLSPGTYDIQVQSPSYASATLPAAFQVTPDPPQQGFLAAAPTTLLDTSTGLGGSQGAVAPGQTVTLQVAGQAGVPFYADSVLLDVTALNPSGAGSVAAFPDGQTRPTGIAGLRYPAHRSTTTLVSVPVTNGSVDLYVGGAGSTNLRVDVVGSFVPTANPLRYSPVGPSPVMNTGTGLGTGKAPMAAHQTRVVTIAGRAGVPADAKAVVLNLTGYRESGSGTVVVYPDGQTRPGVISLSYAHQQQISGLVVVPLLDGKAAITNTGTATTQLAASVQGYYGPTGTLHLTTVGPVNALDTRSGLGVRKGTLGSGKTLSLQMTGVAGIPATAKAVVLSLSVLSPSADGCVTGYADGQPRPGQSSICFAAFATGTNLLVVPMVNGKIDFFNATGNVTLTADLVGYYAP
jgi:hypothetical protein